MQIIITVNIYRELALGQTLLQAHSISFDPHIHAMSRAMLKLTIAVSTEKSMVLCYPSPNASTHQMEFQITISC